MAKIRTASPWLPSNPTLALSLASRRADSDPTATNWYAALSQEIEIGGQRSARMQSADAEVRAASQRVIGAKRAAAIAAWRAYFDVLGARDEVQIATRIEALSVSISEATEAFARGGAIAALDADLADVAATKAKQTRVAAEGRLASARATLASLLAVPVADLVVEGELEPLRDIENRAKGGKEGERPELVALEWQAKAFESRLRLYERQRIPNLTLSGFIQNDGFNERVLGIGLSFPIPLPAPLGRTYTGEITESRVSSQAIRAEATRVNFELNRALSVALIEYKAKLDERDAITLDKYARAEATLSLLANEVKAGKVAPRDAFVAQQIMIELLEGRVRGRHSVCTASVELARAAGIALEDGE